MAVTKEYIVSRMYYALIFVGVFMLGIITKIIAIQYTDGEKYRQLSKQAIIKNDTIFANRGNVYASDGSLLATSMSKYEIRMDLVTVSEDLFQKEVKNLSQELSNMLGNNTSYWERKLRKARSNKNRYLRIARGLGYNDYIKMKNMPIFNKGMYRGGFIAEQTTVRVHPLGKVAERTIGYDDYRGGPGIEGAYKGYLRGQVGWRLKQKIAKGQWKPINDENEKEPIDGKDIYTTIDVNIQDVAHQALLEQLEYFEADHGCVVVMETETGEVKAISNLERTRGGKYYERLNHAIGESHEPGSTFKLASVIVALEDKKIDTGYVVDTGKGVMKVKKQYVRDSRIGGYGKVSLAKAFELSSNVGIVKVIDKYYKNSPEKFVDKIYKMHLQEKIGLEFKGEGSPIIRHPGDDDWDKNYGLQWMAWGYNVQTTPLQMLTFYNAVANGGKMVKPRFVTSIQDQGNVMEEYGVEIIDDRICSKETVAKVTKMMENVVRRGTAKNIYDKNYSMAGKTGTCKAAYWTDNPYYIASFAGFFPVEDPKYSCIVVIHKPNKKKGYYGSTVAAPVFKKIAEKIYTSTLNYVVVPAREVEYATLDKSHQKYHKQAQQSLTEIPDVMGMSGMDAIALLENLGLQVTYSGIGKVAKQSVSAGIKVEKGQKITLKLL